MVFAIRTDNFFKNQEGRKTIFCFQCQATDHAAILGYEKDYIYGFLMEALASTTKDLSVDDMIAMVMKVGETAVNTMALLDEANTTTYGHPEITEVNIGAGKNPGILISGHDLKDMEELPISYDIAWYEQKAVAVLPALLFLGVKGIRLGPTLPGFLSPNVAKVRVEKFDIKPIGTVEEDIEAMMAGN